MLLEKAERLSAMREAKSTRVDIHVNADSVTQEMIDELKTVLHNATRGNCTAVLRLRIPSRSEIIVPLPEAWAVAPTEDLLSRLDRLFGDRSATLG